MYMPIMIPKRKTLGSAIQKMETGQKESGNEGALDNTEGGINSMEGSINSHSKSGGPCNRRCHAKNHSDVDIKGT